MKEKHKWYLITPLTVTQQEGYSDIEKKVTNYTNVMIDLDKKNFLERQKQRQQQQIKDNVLKMNLFNGPAPPSMKINMNMNMNINMNINM